MIVLKSVSVLVGSLLLTFTIFHQRAAGTSPVKVAVCSNPPNAAIRSCPENEEFLCCGACEQLGCDKRFNNVGCSMCPSDCYCKQGYIREKAFFGSGSNRSRCIPVNQCPK